MAVSINDIGFSTKMITSFKRKGYCVIEDVIDENTCDVYMDHISKHFIKSNQNINVYNTKETWTEKNLPPRTKSGLFKTTMSMMKYVWKIQSHPRIKDVFNILYNRLRKKEHRHFLSSSNGFTLYPPDATKPHIYSHINQTTKGVYDIIEGQVVLSDNTVPFVFMPKSHRKIRHILRNLDIITMNKIVEFDEEEMSKFKKTVLKDLEWEAPVIAKKGSLVVYASSLLCSGEPKNTSNEWQCTVHVSLRPAEDINIQYVGRRLIFPYPNIQNIPADDSGDDRVIRRKRYPLFGPTVKFKNKKTCI